MHVSGDDRSATEVTQTRVLVVDDDPTVVDLASQYLEHDLVDVSITVETDPQAAIERIRTGAIDCVICDYSMPTVDGLDVLDVVEREAPGTAFVLFTGSPDEAVYDRIDDESVDRFIRKGEADAFGRLATAVEELR
ncbi:response regulator [Halococcoides cellulosivorans]|nr:response regulator [Halococcoides cellulosivorans]